MFNVPYIPNIYIRNIFFADLVQSLYSSKFRPAVGASTCTCILKLNLIDEPYYIQSLIKLRNTMLRGGLLDIYVMTDNHVIML